MGLSSPLVFSALLLLLGTCANPLNTDDRKNITPTPIDTTKDDPRLDTLPALVNTRIRFEAVIDRDKFPFQSIPDSMRIGIITERRDSIPPYREIFSTSAAYLNLPTVILPLEAMIPARYFLRWKNARLFIGYIVVYVDGNRNREFDFGESVYGISEQATFGFAEGSRLDNIPKTLVRGIQSGPNVMVRTGGQKYAAEFTASPDFDATIFKIQIRGTADAYNVPYPWKPDAELTR